jgi:hypothetical protein
MKNSGRLLHPRRILGLFNSLVEAVGARLETLRRPVQQFAAHQQQVDQGAGGELLVSLHFSSVGH